MPKDKELKSTGIFGRMRHLFSEPENHKRGSFHAHMLSKLEDVPEDEDDLLRFFETKICATVPLLFEDDVRLSPDWKPDGNYLTNHPCARRYDVSSNLDHLTVDLNDVVLACQVHKKCTDYCLRKENGKRRCRFKAPWEVTTEPRLQRKQKPTEHHTNVSKTDVDESEDDDNRDMEFVPHRNHPLIANYSPWASLLWRANNDAQPIFSYYAAVKYVTKYVTKGDFDSSALHQLMSKKIASAEETGKHHVLKKLLRMINALHNERELSVQEAIGNAFRMDLRYNSQKTREIYITSDKPTYELKKNLAFKTAPHAAESNLIGASVAWLDYPFRSAKLNNVCLFEFVQNFTKIKETSHLEKQRHDPNNYFPFSEEHPQHPEYGSTMLHPNNTYAVNILPYNR